MIPILLASAAVFALALIIVIEVVRVRMRSRAKVKSRRRHPRRQPLLEDRIRDAFDEPRKAYGEIFVSYLIWKREHETRLELFAGEPWVKLNSFTRSLVVRHLWRALEALVQGSVVIVDVPAQQWSKNIDAAFDDHGVDPWGPQRPTFGDGPQFARD